MAAVSSFPKMTGGFAEPSGVTDIYADVNGNLRNVVGADWAAIVLVENGRLRAFHLEHPEIEQELQNAFIVQFTPHVGPYTRGILSTITVHVNEPFDVGPYYARYADEPFVRVLGEGKLAEIRYVRGSNFCDIGWVMDKRTKNLVIVSAIDNLVGGTAGMAVQCMNVMFGLDERTGLKLAGMMP